ncbi:MAG: hypothetical protein H7337_20635 [Rhizobacter sp.]|nr:hypothetical protein [Rhizobacter sp.]
MLMTNKGLKAERGVCTPTSAAVRWRITLVGPALPDRPPAPSAMAEAITEIKVFSDLIDP